MRVAVLMLSYERYDTLKQILEHNMNNAGYPFDLFVWDNGSKDERVIPLLDSVAKIVWKCDRNYGIAAPFNVMIDHCYRCGYDAFHVMANDIFEPSNWLADKIRYLAGIPMSGMISICPGEMPYLPSYLSMDLPCHMGDVIGQFMISRRVYEKVGGFNEEFGNYGPIDNDYNARCAVSGFVNYYIPGQSQHIDSSPADLYGYDKAAAVAKTWPIHEANVRKYSENPESAYIPVDGECIVNMKQFWNGEGIGASE
ncbi:glycosyltransferase family 2 protein [Chitinophaga sp. RCC_12]|uniref:glycosyltransferase family 2 protein n=1 Tax=Chitinophaga sp. RCC_12 TaxID=3239226 RepID=UPI003524181D